MNKPVIAIGLDATNPELLEKWMSEGHLPNLSKMRERGSYGRLNNFIEYSDGVTQTADTERIWVMFLTGCLPHKTGYWASLKLERGTYNFTRDRVAAIYDYQEYPLFYALGEKHRVCIFDVPGSTLSNQVNGLQVLGWGGHAPNTLNHSQPPELLSDLIEQYGKNPLINNDFGFWWDKTYINRIQKSINRSTSARAAICRDLLKRQSWDLFLTVFGDTHAVSHDFWHLSQPDHPLYSHHPVDTTSGDAILDAFKEVDRAVGEILEAVPKDAYKLVFSVHGMGKNTADLFTMVYLAEMMYRFSFPGKSMLPGGKLGTTPPPIITNPKRRTWMGEVWQYFDNTNLAKSLLKRWTPGKVQKQLDKLLGNVGFSALSQPTQGNLYWHPTIWYQQFWPQMKAFSLPFFEGGHIRINLKGREPNGIVDVSEYNSLCEKLTEKLYRLTDGRTGEPIVEKVIRTRDNGMDDDRKLPDPDLVVLWRDRPTDVVDSPDWGRIGPITYGRSGGHRPYGFLLAEGEGIPANSSLSEGRAVDLTATILDLMGAEIPEYLDGQPLLKPSFVRSV